MIRLSSPLNARQAEVLRWIADGCPDGRMPGYSYKTTAVALQNRRLVTISKRGGNWRAALTDTGSYYVQHDTYPLTPATDRKQTFVRRERIYQSEQVARRRFDCAELSEVKPVPAAKALSPTLQLIADLLTNGGELRVRRPDMAKYEARVSAAIRYGKVPEGKQLVTKGHRWTTEYVIRLQDAPEWLRASLDPISVPSALRHPHPVVAALQTDKRLVGIDRSVSHRALLLVQGLAAEEKGVWSIGSTGDFSAYVKNKQLTSFELDWSPAYIGAAKQTLDGTWKPTARWRGLEPDGFVKMTTQNPALPAEVRDMMAAKEKAIVEGKFHPFTGPIKDQSGKERIAAGLPMPDGQLASIDWLVEGVQGTLPRG